MELISRSTVFRQIVCKGVGSRGGLSSRYFAPFGLAAVMLVWFPATLVVADNLAIQFDVNSLVGCHDVTPEEFTDTSPNEKLIEVKIQVSSLIRYGNERDLIEYLYRIESVEHTLVVVDFLPQTTLTTNVVGNVGVETTVDKNTSIGITATGKYGQTVGAEASAAAGSNRKSSVRYELLPRLELLAASGTTARGTGVYFKLKPSERTSLEGAKDFALVLRVPRIWSGDYVRVTCEATGHDRGVLRHLERSGEHFAARFIVALYQEGDEAAQRVAARLVQAEQRLVASASAHREEVERRKYASLLHEVGATVSLTGPRIPSNWVENVVHRSANAPQDRFERHLPADVQQAVREYVAAKRALHRLSGSRWQGLAASDVVPLNRSDSR